MSTEIAKLRTGTAYIRVSTDKQEELSPDAQKRLILEYAKRNNIVIAESDIYFENGISGRKADKRPMFQNMIARAKSKEHPYDCIIVWKYSRFARNQEESIVYKSMLKKDDVEVLSVSEPLIDGPFGSLIERIIEWMDEYYSIRLSGEVTRGMTENALRGKYQARPPLGYQVPYPKAIPQIIPEEADTVKLVFDLYTGQMLTPMNIARYLNDHGFTTNRSGKFDTRGVQYILKNQTYIGKTVWNQRCNENNKYKDKSEWIVSDGQHKPIISTEQFEAAQERLKREFAPKGRKPVHLCKHWLSGVVKCENCGATLSAATRKDQRYGHIYTNFQCNGYLKGKCNESHAISASKLVPLVLENLKSTIGSGEVSYTELKSETKVEHFERENLEKQLKDIGKKEQRIKQAYRDGIDTIDEYKDNKELLNKERESIQEKISQIVPVNESVEQEKKDKIMIKKLKNVYDILVDENVSMEEKNEAVKSVLLKIVYNKPSSSLEFYFYLNSQSH